MTIFLFAPIYIYAQSNEMIDTILTEKEATFGETALLILIGAEILPEDSQITDALNYISTHNWGLKNIKAEKPINAGELSLLLMKAFKIKGGFMYTILPCPRYAYRELTYMELIDKKGGPFKKVSGEEVINSLSKVLNWKEEE